MRISHSDCLEHPQRLAEARSALISPRRRWDYIIMINAVNIEHTIMKTPTIFQVPSS